MKRVVVISQGVKHTLHDQDKNHQNWNDTKETIWTVGWWKCQNNGFSMNWPGKDISYHKCLISSLIPILKRERK
jgi:hypothetical protein